MNKLRRIIQEEIKAVLEGIKLTSSTLKKGKVYNWVRNGTDWWEIKYIGLRKDNPNVNASITIGTGYIFKSVDNGKFIELSKEQIPRSIQEQ